MNGLSNKLIGCQIKFALIVGLLVSLAWTLPVEDDGKPLSTEIDAVNTEQPIEAAPVVEEAENVGQLRFPPFNNNGTKLFERFGEKFRNKWTTTTTTTTKRTAG
ncbi:GM10878 [Drosophila sechellia]|uniref:GM10878 n=1 Tax=Drosophila sechellia TaxID=7238 RepID=B4I4D8_DROSE|nr:GM10878 [Drosophila sechellia]